MLLNCNFQKHLANKSVDEYGLLLPSDPKRWQFFYWVFTHTRDRARADGLAEDEQWLKQKMKELCPPDVSLPIKYRKHG